VVTLLLQFSFLHFSFSSISDHLPEERRNISSFIAAVAAAADVLVPS
jgi:hypothetical protein